MWANARSVNVYNCPIDSVDEQARLHAALPKGLRAAFPA